MALLALGKLLVYWWRGLRPLVLAATLNDIGTRCKNVETLARGARRQTNILVALLIREIRLRNSKHAFMQLFDLLEAIFYIITHFVIFTFTGRHIMIGQSLLVWIATGVFPVLYFRSISIRTATAIAAAKSLTTIPYIQPIDYAIARSLCEMIAFLSMFMLFFVMIFMIGGITDAIPYDFTPILISLSLLTLFSFGVGLFNSFVTFVFPLWKFCWSIISRVQIFFSAVFFIPEYMPPRIRDLLVWNPILHFVSMFRTGFYATYPTHFISVQYMLGWTFGALIVGLALERVLRESRLSH